VSPTTVSEAWRSLAGVGAIEARGRNGTYVRSPTGPGGPRRYRRITGGSGHFALDLSSGTPDPALLPDLGPAVSRVGTQSLTSSYLDHPVLPDLEEELVASWPFPAEAFTVVDGAMDALDRVAAVVLRLGDRVVVEHPTFPPLLDLLEQMGCDVVGVDVDDGGPNVDGLAAAVPGARAVFLQSRAQNPAGASISTSRAAELAAVLAAHEALVIEDDHANDISAAPLVSVGRWMPERTVHIRSYSKSHGPDLRLAAVGGAGDVVTAVANRRLLGPGWSSRILQALLVELLRDPRTAECLATATATYARRRAVAVDTLTDRGVGVTGRDGINLWVTVADERSATVALAARGIGVAPGDPFLVRPDEDHLRVTVGLITGPDVHVRTVADHLADAALRPIRQSHHR
ncbi:MAG: aminotransferase class I/II-fold pyridoxal phosphate-dependent enzyme, partial [Acidimicrobiia bacterium]|nr:aminotransferase class I/II-fold pyridoxal phosphate-dependent enzyme [Acidimicrobiia bacterium]